MRTASLFLLAVFSCLLSFRTNAQNVSWAKQLGGTNGDWGYSVAADASGNVYTTRMFTGTADFDPGGGTFNLVSTITASADVFISKLDASGNFVWAKQMGGPSGDIGTSIFLDASGNIYVAGYFEGTADFDPGAGIFNMTSAGVEDIFIAKLDASGNFSWAKQMGGTGPDAANFITLDASGNIYTTGFFENTADFDPGPGTFNLASAGSHDVFISVLDASGNFSWARKIGGTGVDVGYSVKVDAAGNVCTAGYFQSTADFDPGAGVFNITASTGSDAFISRLDASGNFSWAKNFGGGAGYNVANSIALDASGNVYATGIFESTVDFDPGPGTFNLTSAGFGDIFVSKLDASGNFAWVKQMGGSNGEVGYSIALDASGNIFTTGQFGGTADFDPGAGTSNLTASGGGDIFISKLDASGNFSWAGGFGASGGDLGNCIFLDAPGYIYTTGLFTGTGDFDPGAGTLNLSATGQQDIFVHKMTPCSFAPSQPGSISGSTILCAGSSNTYNIAAVSGATSYTWTLPGGWSGTSTTTSITATAGSSGTITVTANNLCGSSAAQTFSVTVSNPALTLTPASATCSGSCNGSITAGTTGGIAPYTYSPSLTGLCAASYTVTVTDNIGCTAQQTTTVTEPVTLTLSTSAITGATCNGTCDGSVTLSASGGTAGYTYSPSTTNLCAATYTFTVTDANGCTATASATITEPTALTASVTSNPESGLCDGNATAAPSGGTGSYTYLWNDPGAQTTATATGLCTGYYCVTVTDANGCTATSCDSVDTTVGIDVQTEKNGITIFPNPNYGTFHLVIDQQEAILVLTDVSGRFIESRTLYRGTNRVETFLPAGIYFVRLTADGKETTVKMIVSH